jgi:hypothetical protein
MVSICARCDKDDAIFIILSELKIHIGKIFFNHGIISLNEQIIGLCTEHLRFSVISSANDIALEEKIVDHFREEGSIASG